MAEKTFPTIRLCGSGRDIGMQHGSALRSRIHALWRFYRAVFARFDDARLERWAARIGSHLEAAFPDLHEELIGIAAGADLPLWQIIVINARTELLHQIESAQECTALYVRRGCILGQNWDFARALEDLAVVLHIEKAGRTILTLTEPGMLAKIGLNSSGVGVCLNRLSCTLQPDGVPVHALLRAVLETDSYEQAVALMADKSSGSESNVLIGDDGGNGSNVELAGGCVGIYGRGAPVIVHTNHYVKLRDLEGSTAEDVAESAARLRGAEELAQRLNGDGWDEVARLLRDARLCRPYGPSDLWAESGTVAAVVLDLPRRTMHYTPGSPFAREFAAISLQ